MTSLNQTIPLTPELMDSARAIVDYMKEDEWKSLTNCRREDFDLHIYKHVMALATAFGTEVRAPVFAGEVEDDGETMTNICFPKNYMTEAERKRDMTEAEIKTAWQLISRVVAVTSYHDRDDGDPTWPALLQLAGHYGWDLQLDPDAWQPVVHACRSGNDMPAVGTR